MKKLPYLAKLEATAEAIARQQVRLGFCDGTPRSRRLPPAQPRSAIALLILARYSLTYRSPRAARLPNVMNAAPHLNAEVDPVLFAKSTLYP